jgi:hypothetical protein
MAFIDLFRTTEPRLIAVCCDCFQLAIPAQPVAQSL